MKKILGLMLMLSVMLTPASAFAADSYSDAVGEKLQSGLTNTLFGWSKVFSVPPSLLSSRRLKTLRK